MNWTTDKPTKPGYYWARGVFRITADKTEEVIELVEVYRMTVTKYFDDKGNRLSPPWEEAPQDELSVSLMGDEGGSDISRYTHWYGPLEVPEPPHA